MTGHFPSTWLCPEPTYALSGHSDLPGTPGLRREKLRILGANGLARLVIRSSLGSEERHRVRVQGGVLSGKTCQPGASCAHEHVCASPTHVCTHVTLNIHIKYVHNHTHTLRSGERSVIAVFLPRWPNGSQVIYSLPHILYYEATNKKLLQARMYTEDLYKVCAAT